MTETNVWFDRVLAGVLLIACETEFLVNIAVHSTGHGWPVGANALLLAGITLPTAARRREPEAVAAASLTALVLLAVGSPQFNELVVPQFVLFIPSYAVAAYGHRLHRLVGLALCLVLSALAGVVASSGQPIPWFVVAVIASSWAFGRYVRSNRTLTARLRAIVDQIVAERHDRERLVVAEQRSHIARELQAVVADHVSTMTIQARAAQLLLQEGNATADEAMATIEETGRQTMNDLRRLLGVLRRADSLVDLAPQPGVGQIPKLVERVRHDHRPVTLRVDGDPAALPATTDLGLYRVLEDVLRGDAGVPIGIALRFGVGDVELHVTVQDGLGQNWPTIVTSEWVALCEGSVDVSSDANTTVLTVRMPRVLDGVLA